jgi:hypothetical protein
MFSLKGPPLGKEIHTGDFKYRDTISESVNRQQDNRPEAGIAKRGAALGFFSLFHERCKNYVYYKVRSLRFLYFLYINFLHMEGELRIFDHGKKIVQPIDVGLEMESEMHFPIKTVLLACKYLVGLDVQFLPAGPAL